MTMRPCRTCGDMFHAVSKTRYCSDACRCGTDAGYNAGCKCTRCKAAHARNHKRLRIRPNPYISTVGATRRVHALARLGWSQAELSRRLGHTKSYLMKVLRNDSIEVITHLRIVALYDELSMTWCTSPTAGRTAAEARARGWAPPLAWDERRIDDPKARPVVRTPVGGVDEAVVERILGGDWTVPATREERTEVIRRWAASGRPLVQLEDHTGWKAVRYFKLSDQAEAS